MKRLTTFIALTLLAMPLCASAHAAPLKSEPASSEKFETVPREVRILFSERLESGASVITVKAPNGAVVSGESIVDSTDARALVTKISGEAEGAYTVSWSVVSRDDGHFTRGAYPFLVGGGEIPATAASEEIVQISTTDEALAMTVELIGNGLLWASLVIFAFIVRTAREREEFQSVHGLLQRIYSVAIHGGAFLAIAGGILQLVLKTRDLQLLHETDFYSVLGMYADTVAGEATIVRIVVALAVAITFAIGSKAIARASRITLYEILAIVLLCVFAYFRAKVSHATANPFFPDFSVAINFVHLIEKDIWAGIVIILTVFTTMRGLAATHEHLMRRIFQILAVNMVLLSITGSYIIWLHLKSFQSLLSTSWGSAFIQLLTAALLLVAMRAYHAWARLCASRRLISGLPFSLAAEAALAVLVVYFSSVVIITSPPLSLERGPIFSAHDQGVSIELRASPYEDDMAALNVVGEQTHLPEVMIESDLGNAFVNLEKKYDGGYVFPLALLQDAESVSIRVAQDGGYDAHAKFDVSHILLDESGEGDRRLDFFAMCFLAFAAFGILCGVLLYVFAGKDAGSISPRPYEIPSAYALAGFVSTLLLAGAVIVQFGTSTLANPYKAVCESDGNMWHLMLPMSAGEPTSLVPREGCMWGMGNFQYMFPDRREYEYNSSFPEARAYVTFSREPVRAGVPVDFTVNVREPDGSPARLFVDMERLLHVVIVSKDQQEYIHLHPDDVRPLTDEEIQTATFKLSHTFRKAGEYLMSIDYAQGIRLESTQVPIRVDGTPVQKDVPTLYTSPAEVGGLTVELKTSIPLAGQVTTFVYDIRRGGQPAHLEPYLSAAMHIAVVKNDFTSFAHIHGEYHAPGAAVPPVSVREGKIIHSMAAMSTPPSFTSPVDAHVIFPTPGLYTVWSQFQSEGKIYSVPFTVRVET